MKTISKIYHSVSCSDLFFIIRGQMQACRESETAGRCNWCSSERVRNDSVSGRCPHNAHNTLEMQVWFIQSSSEPSLYIIIYYYHFFTAWLAEPLSETQMATSDLILIHQKCLHYICKDGEQNYCIWKWCCLFFFF